MLNSGSRPSRSLPSLLLALLAIGSSACTTSEDAAHDPVAEPTPSADQATEGPAAERAASGQASVNVSSEAQTPAAEPAVEPGDDRQRAGRNPGQSSGRTSGQNLVLALPAPARLAGVAARVEYDADRFELGDVVQLRALEGFACQSNVLHDEGVARIACAGLVGEERSGELLSVPVASRDGAPATAADFRLTEVELVDYEGAALTTTRLLLSVGG